MTELENSIKVLTEHTQHYVPTEDLEHLYAVIEAAGKLAEYETAEEEGRLVVLPCKSGQDLFGIYNGAIVDGYADGYLMEKISVDSNSEHWIWFQDKYSKNFWKVSFEDFGKTIFLIREEAEKALKEMEGKS